MGNSRFNVADFGAIGDGAANDTAAIQAALDAAEAAGGIVHVPEGTYLVGRLKLHPHTGIVGEATWSYREPGGSILKLNDAEVSCLLDITGARGATINGLSLDGGDLGTGVHGILMGEFPEKNQEDAPRIERCHISHFTGDGIRLDPAWCFSIRSCEVIFNGGHGLAVRGWDGFVLDNWFSGNGGAGYASLGHHASNTLTGNRIEWNKGGGIVLRGGGHYNITGNYIDRSGGPAIVVRAREDGSPAFCMTITGNVIYRSGKPEWTSDDPLDSAHVRLENAHGIAFTGNSLCVGQDDGGGTNSPQLGIVLGSLANSVVTNNTLHIGAITELIHDLGDHENCVIKDNPGSLLLNPELPIWASPQR